MSISLFTSELSLIVRSLGSGLKWRWLFGELYEPVPGILVQ